MMNSRRRWNDDGRCLTFQSNVDGVREIRGMASHRDISQGEIEDGGDGGGGTKGEFEEAAIRTEKERERECAFKAS